MDDVIDVMRTCDADSDQNLNWGEFAEMLRWNDEALGRCDKVLLASGAVKIVKEELDRWVCIGPSVLRRLGRLLVLSVPP